MLKGILAYLIFESSTDPILLLILFFFLFGRPLQ